MKKLITSILMLGIFETTGLANNSYEKTMEQNITMIFNTAEADQMNHVANKFVRIGEAEKSKWLPFYYSSMTYIFKSFQLQDAAEKDDALESAQRQLNRALKLESENSEISALQGFLYMISLSVDPASRGQSISPKAFAQFEKALAIDPKNPRALLFKGQMLYGSAQFFGTGTETACQMISRSIEIFEKSKNQKGIEPSWGLRSALSYNKNCNSFPKEQGDDK
ncbi:MAG: tetratricopeptide (TPR) repeat protein [Cyclobacteriaceae bacterium]|jgi:tetratricopeptide (TPR) repeat protein